MSTIPDAVHEGDHDAAHFRIETNRSGQASVTVRRSYPSGRSGKSSDRVWAVVSDFGAIKVLFPSLLRLYLTYPDDTENQVGLIRDMTFTPPPGGHNLSFGIEQLIEFDESKRRLVYVSVLGLPVQDYRSEMSITGKNACELVWQSTCRVKPDNIEFLSTLASILAGGANQIAVRLGLA